MLITKEGDEFFLEIVGNAKIFTRKEVEYVWSNLYFFTHPGYEPYGPIELARYLRGKPYRDLQEEFGDGPVEKGTRHISNRDLKTVRPPFPQT